MVNRQNYHWAKAHLEYLRDVMQLKPRSVERYQVYLRHTLLWADDTPFTQAPDIRPTLTAYISQPGTDTLGETEPLAPATVRKIIQTTHRFFLWAKMTYPREFREVSPSWIDTLRPPRFAASIVEHTFITLDEILQLAHSTIPESDLALRRDQAAAVMLYLSGMRVGALGSLPIEAVDLSQRAIKQWTALGVRTKNSKSATTYLLPIPELLTVVEQWDGFVRAHLPPTAIWCTPVISQWGEQTLSAGPAGANRHIAINKRFRKLFAQADLPHKSPHKFRHGHAVWALQHARTMADYKAISQNLMHTDIRVTDGVYASLLGNEVQQRVAGLAGQVGQPLSIHSDLAAYLSQLAKSDIPEALHILANRLAQ